MTARKYGANVVKFAQAAREAGHVRSGYDSDRLVLHVDSRDAPEFLALADSFHLTLSSASRTQAFLLQKGCALGDWGKPPARGSLQVFASKWYASDLLVFFAERVRAWDDRLRVGQPTDLPALPDGRTATSIAEFATEWDPADGRDLAAALQFEFASAPFCQMPTGSRVAQTFARLVLDETGETAIAIGGVSSTFSDLLHEVLTRAPLLDTARALEAAPYQEATLPLTDLLANATDMVGTLGSGRESLTPDDPILVRYRPDMPGRWEIADGHHRVARALRDGRTTINVTLDWVPDDEPLEGPFFDFADAQRTRDQRVVAVRTGPRGPDDIPAGVWR